MKNELSTINHQPSTVPDLADKAAIREINKLFAVFKEKTAAAAEATIDSVNLLRQMGLHFQGLCRHENLHFSFYQNLKAKLPEELNYDRVQLCIRMARKFPEEVTTMQEVASAQQLVFLAGGYLELPERTEDQVSHEMTPVVFFFHTLQSARVHLEKRLAEAAEWDELTRRNIRVEVDKFDTWLEGIKSKL